MAGQITYFPPSCSSLNALHSHTSNYEETQSCFDNSAIPLMVPYQTSVPVPSLHTETSLVCQTLTSEANACCITQVGSDHVCKTTPFMWLIYYIHVYSGKFSIG